MGSIYQNSTQADSSQHRICTQLGQCNIVFVFSTGWAESIIGIGIWLTDFLLQRWSIKLLRPLKLMTIGPGTNRNTNMTTNLLKDSVCAIFLKSWWIKHVCGYLTLSPQSSWSISSFVSLGGVFVFLFVCLYFCLGLPCVPADTRGWARALASAETSSSTTSTASTTSTGHGWAMPSRKLCWESYDV